jgi:vacuolar protein sorting-associated protein 54
VPPASRAQDVVELQLLREVAGRSSSFFQAASTLQGLQGRLSEAVGCIRGLRQELAEADTNMYSTAAAVKGLQARRENLQDTLDITKVGRGGGWVPGGGGDWGVRATSQLVSSATMA